MYITVSFLLATALSLLVACTSSSSHQREREIVSERSDEIGLTDTSMGKSSIEGQVDDLIGVSITVVQDQDMFRICGRPTVIDTFGNPLATLTPQRVSTNVEESLSYLYRYGFFAAASGSYSVELDNEECDIALLSVSAKVQWKVSR